jgi:ABC-type oligopeptide transport system ATPase subunit
MSGNVLIRVENLQKSFDAKKTLLSRIRKDSMKVYAVDNVSFSLNKGEIIGLIGESGCGKTTTARILLKLVDADGGKVY